MGKELEVSTYTILPKKEPIQGTLGLWRLVKPVVASYNEIYVPGGNFMLLSFRGMTVGGGIADDPESIIRATTRLVSSIVFHYENYLAVKDTPDCPNYAKENGKQIGQYLILCRFDAAGKS